VGEHAADTAIALGLAWRGSLPVAIDLENYTLDADKVTDAQRDEFVRGMVDTLERRLGRLPIMYVGATFWGYQQTNALAQELHTRGVPLWLVNYSPEADTDESIFGWPHAVWQFSGGGDHCFADPWPGLPHPVDQNRYRGTLAELRGLAGG
jgi:GH25 family lysozyme M1 (1,4-beta-N-acetylmuramidase)